MRAAARPRHSAAADDFRGVHGCRRSAALRRVGLKLRMPGRARVDFIRFTIRVRSPTRQSRSRFGRLASSSEIVGTRTMLQWPRSPRGRPKNPRLSNSVSSRLVFAPAVLPRYRDTRGMDDVSLNATRLEPARQPEAVAAGWAETSCGIRVIVRPGPDRLIRQRCSRPSGPFPGLRLQLLARLTLNAGKHAGNEPARLAELDDRYDRAILVQGDGGLLKSGGWGRALFPLSAGTKPAPFSPAPGGRLC